MAEAACHGGTASVHWNWQFSFTAQFNAILWLSEKVNTGTQGNSYWEYEHWKEFRKEKNNIPEDSLGEEKEESS